MLIFFSAASCTSPFIRFQQPDSIDAKISALFPDSFTPSIVLWALDELAMWACSRIILAMELVMWTFPVPVMLVKTLLQQVSSRGRGRPF